MAKTQPLSDYDYTGEPYDWRTAHKQTLEALANGDIELVHVGGDRYTLKPATGSDLTLKQHQYLLNNLEAVGALPTSSGHGWESHGRDKDGNFIISVDQPEGFQLIDLLPMVVMSVATAGIGSALAASLNIPATLANSVIAGGLELAQGGDLQDALVAGLMKYGMDAVDIGKITQDVMSSDFATDLLTSPAADTIFNGVDNVTEYIDNLLASDPASFVLDTVGKIAGLPQHAVEALAPVLGDLGASPEAILNFVQDNADILTSATKALPTAPELYDMYRTWEGQNEYEPPIIDPSGGLPTNPDAGGSDSGGGLLTDPNQKPVEPVKPSGGGLLEQPHIPNDTTGPEPLTQQQKWDAALEDYWAKNPEELEKAAKKNPGAFGGLLEEDSTFPTTDVGWRYMGGKQWKNMETGEKIKVPQHPELGAGNTVKGEVYPFPQYTYDKKTEEPAKETIDMPILTTGGYSKAGFPDWLTNDSKGKLVRKDGQPVTQGDRNAVRDWGLDQANTYDYWWQKPGALDGLNNTDGPSPGGGSGGPSGPGAGPGDQPGTPPPSEPVDLDTLIPGWDDKEEEPAYEGKGLVHDPYDTTGIRRPDYGSVEQNALYDVPERGMRPPPILPAENSGQPSYDEWYEEWLKQKDTQEGLLPLLAGKRTDKGLI